MCRFNPHALFRRYSVCVGQRYLKILINYRHFCASCKWNGFYPCCSLEAASTGWEMEMEMTASDAQALVILPQGELCSDLGKPCRDFARGRGFQRCFRVRCPRGGLPLRVFLCRRVHDTSVCLCAVAGTEGSWVGGHMCSHRRNFPSFPLPPNLCRIQTFPPCPLCRLA